MPGLAQAVERRAVVVCWWGWGVGCRKGDMSIVGNGGGGDMAGVGGCRWVGLG